MRSEMVITVRDLNLFYGEFQALKDVPMDVKRNHITALIGPSGCGKSTLLRTLNRMNDLIPSVRVTGSILLEGKNIYDSGTDVCALRLCVARLLAVEPEVILMDEPCSALDPMSTGRIEELMLDLKANYTIVIVTHNMQQAARISDYSGYMLLGEMIEFGQTAGIFTSPQDKRTQDYVSGRYG